MLFKRRFWVLVFSGVLERYGFNLEEDFKEKLDIKLVRIEY